MATRGAATTERPTALPTRMARTAGRVEIAGRVGVALVLAWAGAACSNTTDVDVPATRAVVEAPAEVTLRVGEVRSVAGTNLRVTLVRVPEDSRCPIDAVCVWEGNAVVEIAVAVGAGAPVPIQINTTLEPRAVQIAGATFTVLELQPAPRASQPTDPASYVARIRVE